MSLFISKGRSDDPAEFSTVSHLFCKEANLSDCRFLSRMDPLPLFVVFTLLGQLPGAWCCDTIVLQYSLTEPGQGSADL